MKDQLVQYIRNAQRHPIGVVVAVRNEYSGYTLGVSVCHKNDRFNKQIGLAKAVGRARANVPYTSPVRLEKFLFTSVVMNEEVEIDVVKYTINSVISRANKYFKVGVNV